MDCPRCGDGLRSFALDGARAVECGACGYVDVAADLRPEENEPETWEEALRRFREERRAETDAEAALGEAVALTVGGETYRVSPDTYDRVQSLTAKQRAVIRELLAEPSPTDPDRTRAEIAEDAGVHPSYVGTVASKYGDIAATLAERRRSKRE